MPWRRYLYSGCAGILAAVLSIFGLFTFSSRSFAQFFGLSNRHSAGIAASAIPRKWHKSGSSSPPPKGTIISKLTAGQTDMQLRKLNCNVFPPAYPGLATSSVPELRKLAQYERLCSGAVAERTSFFISTPATDQQAQSSGQWVANTLKAYAAAGVKPLVFMEPTDENGGNVDLDQLANGTFDSALKTFYQTLQSSGVSSDTMGMWVYLPEGNLPVWTTTDPSVFTAVVTKMTTYQKQFFPDSLTSLMLDSESYSPRADWGSGKYVSLLPYVQNLPKGLIDSFGLQGFPWSPPSNQSSDTPLNDPKTYLQINFAMDAAHALGIKNIWFNTGTFHEMYASQAGQTVFETDLNRQRELDGVLQLASEVKSQGFNMSIHLFSQNKAALPEGTDWSYWNKTPGDKSSTYVFSTFVHDAEASNIPIWLYDTE